MALQKKQDYEKACASRWQASPAEDSLSFRDAAMLWLEDSREDWKLSTYVKYQSCLEKHILPSWGPLYLQNLRQADYDQLMSRLKGHLQASSLSAVNTVLHSIVRFSLSKEYLRASPFGSFHPSTKKETCKIDILTADETTRITRYSGLHLTTMTLGVLLALYEGIRLGELCALKWGDINLEEGTLLIRSTLQRIKNPSPEPGAPKTILYFGRPKNGRERSIPIHPLLLEILKEHMEDRSADHYILRDQNPMEPRVYSYHFKKILDEAGIRDINFHVLRHTFASNCVEAGMDIKALSEILGHSSIKITMDRYVHLSMDFKKSQISVLEFPIFPK